MAPFVGHLPVKHVLLPPNSISEGRLEKGRQALGLNSATRLGVSLKEVAKGHKQFLSMPDAAFAERLVNIVDNHRSDFPATVRLL